MGYHGNLTVLHVWDQFRSYKLRSVLGLRIGLIRISWNVRIHQPPLGPNWGILSQSGVFMISGIQTPVYIHQLFCCCSSSFMSYVAKMMECSGAIWRHHLHPSPNSILTHFNSTSIFRPMKMATLNIRSISFNFFDLVDFFGEINTKFANF